MPAIKTYGVINTLRFIEKQIKINGTEELNAYHQVYVEKCLATTYKKQSDKNFQARLRGETVVRKNAAKSRAGRA